MSVPADPQSCGKAKGGKLGGRGCVCWGGGGGRTTNKQAQEGVGRCVSVCLGVSLSELY